MRLLKRAAAIALAGLMGLSLASCSGDTSWSAEYNGNRLKAGVYISYMIDAFSSANVKVNPDGDEKMDVFKQQVDGKDFSQWVQDETAHSVKKHFAISEKFQEMGLSFDEAKQAEINSTMEYQWAYFEALYTKNGVSKESFASTIENTYQSSEIFQKYYGEGGEEEVPQADLQKTFEEQYIKFCEMAFSLKDSAGEALDDTKKEEARAKAKEYYDKAQSGADFDSLIIEREKELAKEQGQDESAIHSHEEKGVHDTIIKKDDSRYPDKFMEEVPKAEIGKVIMFEDDDYVYLAQRLDILEDPQDLENARLDILYDLKYEDYEALLDGWADGLNVTFNDAAVKRYTPKKIKMS